ncbi:MAG: hypothetical protein RDU01_12155, partial [Thermodesulfovibrionales bacterium]|nr:hypothetical protein [Thermodesulfovibrionales bacterium]
MIFVYEKTVLGVGQTPHILWVLTGAPRRLSMIEQGILCSIIFSLLIKRSNGNWFFLPSKILPRESKPGQMDSK